MLGVLVGEESWDRVASLDTCADVKTFHFVFRGRRTPHPGELLGPIAADNLRCRNYDK